MILIIIVYILLISAFLCLIRIMLGPTAPDRTVAIDILGILIVGFCALFALTYNLDFMLNIAITWSLLSFIGTIALAKYLEGRDFDE
ncbi:MAG TPA: monovalent cation/H+ antiporter complex subunit F [bacterium]|nr:monovalent cation/H+ antiporter complex subunit F [bacterium]HOL47535.1 monovalent cation/H+ antiporter complex subunit F [bacterium]HPQ19113.1 monovalent cation/H+ antiporter complex subunit F [bacterium]